MAAHCAKLAATSAASAKRYPTKPLLASTLSIIPTLPCTTFHLSCVLSGLLWVCSYEALSFAIIWLCMLSKGHSRPMLRRLTSDGTACPRIRGCGSEGRTLNPDTRRAHTARGGLDEQALFSSCPLSSSSCRLDVNRIHRIRIH